MSSLKNESIKVVALLLLVFGFALTNGWDYSAPGKWPIEYPLCGGQRQSPIDIQSRRAAYSSRLASLKYINYNSWNTGYFTVANNGHSVSVTVAKNSGISIISGLLPNKYTLEQFHFHWGSDNTKGSEHAIDGKYYPLEIHFVHYNSDRYPSFKAASDKPNGLAVIGVLVKVNPYARAIAEVDELIKRFSKITYKGDTTTMTSFRVDSLLPARSNYFRYFGSLTTPPCYESVIWTVLSTSIEFTPKQIMAFRRLHANKQGHRNVPLVNNMRPIQPLNGRSVWKSFR